jgi:hypothetical protein
MKKKFQANAAFFNQGKGEEQENFLVGGEAPKRKGGEAIEIAGVGEIGGIISEKGLISAFKRAKQSGTFIVQN